MIFTRVNITPRTENIAKITLGGVIHTLITYFIKHLPISYQNDGSNKVACHAWCRLQFYPAIEYQSILNLYDIGTSVFKKHIHVSIYIYIYTYVYLYTAYNSLLYDNYVTKDPLKRGSVTGYANRIVTVIPAHRLRSGFSWNDISSV